MTYIKQKWTELKGEICSSTVIVRDSDTPHSIMDGTAQREDK